MKIFLVVVLFKLILLLNICCAYHLPIYHVANQDLLKGILLGALLTQHKHPPHFLNVPMPLPYYGNYGQPHPQPYPYSSPTNNVQNEQNQDMNQDYRPTDSPNANSQQMGGHSQHSQQETESQTHEQQSQPQQQYSHHQPQHQSPPQQQQYNNQQHPHQQQYQQQPHQQSESLYDSVVTDPPSVQSNQTPQRTEPVIPSMETIQRNLGFPGHNVILMILPNFDEKMLSKEQPNRTEISTESPEQEQHSSEQQMINNYENTIKTNAVKIGSKHLNSKGWKPVPKATTTTTTPEPIPVEYNNRFSRYNMNKYIERSQFGLRNKELTPDINQYYSIDQMHH